LSSLDTRTHSMQTAPTCAMTCTCRNVLKFRSNAILLPHIQHTGEERHAQQVFADIIMHLSKIYRLKIEDRWMLSEIPKTSRDVVEELGFIPPIP